MSDGLLDAWSEVTEWSAELTCSVIYDTDILSSLGNDEVVGAHRTRWQVVASGVLAGHALWQVQAALSASWQEDSNADESGHGWIGKSRSTVLGSGTGTGTISLAMGIETTHPPSGRYEIRVAGGLTFDVTMTSSLLTQDPVTNTPSESHHQSTGSRDVFIPPIDEALPHSGLVLEGNKQIQLSSGAIADVSWTLHPLNMANTPPNPCGAILRFLDFRNHVIDPNVQALAVSNHVSSDEALQGVGIVGFDFEAHATDLSAFRLEVEDSTAGASVEVVLQVGFRARTIFQLSTKSGNRYRGPFLRLVTDNEDERSLATSQNIYCALGEKVVLSYRKPPPDDCEDRHEIGIGRFPGENNNDHPSHLRHDIRELTATQEARLQSSSLRVLRRQGAAKTQATLGGKPLSRASVSVP